MHRLANPVVSGSSQSAKIGCPFQKPMVAKLSSIPSGSDQVEFTATTSSRGASGNFETPDQTSSGSTGYADIDTSPGSSGFGDVLAPVLIANDTKSGGDFKVLATLVDGGSTVATFVKLKNVNTGSCGPRIGTTISEGIEGATCTIASCSVGATVIPTVNGTHKASGTVTFTYAGASISALGGGTCNALPLDASTSPNATCDAVGLPVGVDTITATYSGNAHFDGATGSLSITVIEVPSAPTGVTATAHNASATISFSPPANDGDSTVTGYKVTAADTTTPANGGQTAAGSSSPITVNGLTNGDSYTFTVTASNAAGTGAASNASNAVTPQPVATIIADGSCGYWKVGKGGMVSNFGCAAADGSLNENLSNPIVAAAAVPGGGGFWLVASDGGIFSFGDAGYYGAPSGVTVVSISATSDGKGYWVFGSNGKVYPYGDATSLTSPPGSVSTVSATTTPDGNGYWLVTSSGGIFSYGDAGYYGSPDTPVVDISSTPDGKGYWLVGSNGTIYPYGDATSYGDLTGSLTYPIVGMADTPDGGGYWMVDSDGDISAFGDATSYG
jgi:hypothetical protein